MARQRHERHFFAHGCAHANAAIKIRFYTQAEGIVPSRNAYATLPVSESACEVTLPEVMGSA